MIPATVVIGIYYSKHIRDYYLPTLCYLSTIVEDIDIFESESRNIPRVTMVKQQICHVINKSSDNAQVIEAQISQRFRKTRSLYAWFRNPYLWYSIQCFVKLFLNDTKCSEMSTGRDLESSIPVDDERTYYTWYDYEREMMKKEIQDDGIDYQLHSNDSSKPVSHKIVEVQHKPPIPIQANHKCVLITLAVMAILVVSGLCIAAYIKFYRRS
ncbi:hypothetical protein RF11_03576 [Thelohanellus kitauei]|uniref:Uncharacterized protein n=1 Tax=Thelohanellus kitauei TaxID=669202 RepID=A0A0C2NCC0_THEKT|nr:hypothetical protein RF11_03576 [Thelohanellus kitauei]